MTQQISKSSRSYRALTYLFLFGLAIALPLSLLLGALLLHSASVQRTQLENRVSQVLDALVSDIDRDLDRDITILHTLATSEALKNADWRTFYNQANAGLQGRAYLVLIDSNGRQLVNTYVPYGEQPAVTGDPETLRRILQTKMPVVSNLFVSLVVKKPVFNVSIPILQDGQVRYVMSLGLLTDDLVALLASQNLGPEWVTLIWDANGVIVARSRDDTRYVGKPLPQNMREQDQRRIVRTSNLDGSDVLHATARSKVSGWGVGVNIPYALVTEQIRNSLLLWGAFATLAATAALALGLFFARQITAPLSVAAGAAAAFGHGKPFAITGSRLREADAFLTALSEARQAREKLTEELKQSRDWFQTTLASIGDGVIVTNEKGRVTFLNGVSQSLTGWSQEEAAGVPLEQIFVISHEETGAPVENPASLALREGRIVALANHTKLTAKDGREIPIDDSAAPIRDAAGNIIGVVLVFRDISERKKAEETTRRLAAIVESSDDAIIGKDLNGKIISWNRGAERIFGYSAAEAVGKPVSIIAADHDEMPTILDHIKRGERIDHYDTVRKTKTGNVVDMSVTISPLRDSAGHVVGASKIGRDITKAKQAAQRLRASEEQARQARDWLQTTLASIGDGVIATDEKGRVTFLNGVSQSLTGWSQEEAAGVPLEQVFVISNEETGAPVENPVSKALREGRIVGLANHTKLTAKDGHEIPIDDSAAPIRDNEGNIIGVVLVFRDISERKQAEEAKENLAEELKQSRDWLQATLSSIGDGVIATDEKGRITFLNPVSQSLTGWSEEEAAGKPLEQVFVIRSAQTDLEPENPVAKVLREGRIVGLANHTWLIARDGRRIPIDDSAAPIRDGDKIAGVVLVFRDITERLKAEERMRLTVEAAPNAMIMVGHEGQIVLVNSQTEKLFGYKRSELIGKPVEILVPERYRSGHGALRASFFGDPAARWMGAGRDLFGLRRDGREVPVEIGLNPISTSQGDFVLAAIIDISERKHAEEKLRAVNEDLLRSNEDLNQFAFAASHDLQEPLRMITSYSQLLLKGYRGQLDGEAETCVGFIADGTKRMRGLLADLLAYTQLTGERPETVAEVDLNEVFRTALDNCKTTIAETGAVVTSAPLPAVLGHEAHFVQLLQNLISNGLKYRGESPPRIHISAERQNGEWRIAVKDNGIGIAPEYHKQIFGVFKRLHGQSIAGTGIGLAICQRVLHRYRGRIWVDSQVGQGATFYFTLPVAEKGAAAHEG